MLVIHNNSDGFGQNIETEGMVGSLDGAIGSSSSAAASLERNRKDLLDFICSGSLKMGTVTRNWNKLLPSLQLFNG